MSRRLDIPEGTQFGDLTVICEAEKIGDVRSLLCQCKCGKQKIIRLNALTRGATRSCGACNLIKVEPGQKYGNWEVLSVKQTVHKGERRTAICKCKCGNIREVACQKLIRGLTLSCGCWRADAKHHKRLHVVWRHMQSRCYNKNNPKYPQYGGRGIVVCNEWLGAEGFARFVEWSYKHDYDENASTGKCTIDRIDVNGNYEPSNCRWADPFTQANNKQNTIYIEHNGEKHTISEWAIILGIPRRRIENRVRYGYPTHKILYPGNLKEICYEG